jgi:hypothetical protein
MVRSPGEGRLKVPTPERLQDGVELQEGLLLALELVDPSLPGQGLTHHQLTVPVHCNPSIMSSRKGSFWHWNSWIPASRARVSLITSYPCLYIAFHQS